MSTLKAICDSSAIEGRCAALTKHILARHAMVNWTVWLKTAVPSISSDLASYEACYLEAAEGVLQGCIFPLGDRGGIQGHVQLQARGIVSHQILDPVPCRLQQPHHASHNLQRMWCDFVMGCAV